MKSTLLVTILIFQIVVAACSTGNDSAILIDPVTGKHSAGWLVAATGGTHPDAARASAFATCRECHGTDLRGGIVLVSCFSNDRNGISCHPAGPVGHPLGWREPAQHGQAGAKAAPGVSSGFAYCASCHGAQFTNGSVLSCLSCHTHAPHPDKPWRGTTATLTTHTTTDAGNAPQCVQCHANGANSSIVPSPPALSGTAPGCFNNTLCHGPKSAHAFPNPGANHRTTTAVAECLGCHQMGTSGSAYPVAAGTPPNCRSCHLAANPAVGNHCADCHGDATGRPNGSAFPNRAGRHSLHFGEVAGLTCDACHAGGGSGAASHGNSNRSVKTAQNVTVTFSGVAAGMGFTRNNGSATVTCNGSCHGQNHSGYTW